MSYQVLARKWRPKRFADLVGQEHVVRALTNALRDKRLHHAYLLTGTRGVGKTTIARILAKSLNCDNGLTVEPCGVCAACTQIDAGRFVDVLEIDAASNTGIDSIREVLENAQYVPTAGYFKVYIIDEVHMLSKSAFNAMLKTLEEPPEHAKFILATTDPQKVPVTVLSRCLQFCLRNMTSQQVAGYLAHVLKMEGLSAETPALALLGRAAAGSMRDALSLLDQAIAYGEVTEQSVCTMLGVVDSRYVHVLLQALVAGDGPQLMAEANALAARGMSFDNILAELVLLLQQIALAQSVPQAIDIDDPQRDALMALAGQIHPEDVQLYYQIALLGRKDLLLAPDEQVGFNMTLLRMLAFRPGNTVTSAAPGRATQAPGAVSALIPVKVPLSPPAVTNTTTPAWDTDYQASREGARGILEAIKAPDDQSMQGKVDKTADAVSLWQFDGDWQALVTLLSSQLGAARMLAQNAVLTTWTADCLELSVPESLRHLSGRDYQEKLKTALSEQFGRPIQLIITIDALQAHETPAMTNARQRQARFELAQEAIHRDPTVQQLVQELGATLLVDTIKPVEE